MFRRDAICEATRAVHDALPFLTAAEVVSLLSVNPGKHGPKPGGADPDQMVEHLKRHGVVAIGEVLTGDAKRQILAGRKDTYRLRSPHGSLIG